MSREAATYPIVERARAAGSLYSK